MDIDIRRELFTSIYVVRSPEDVHPFDWKFVLPVTEELDKLDKKYLLAYSHYINDQREDMPDNYLRFRLFGTAEVMKRFQEIEAGLISKLGYSKEEDDFSFENQAKDFGITMKEMMEIFKLWNKAARLKIELIKLWLEGNGSSWHKGTHYVFNTLGFMQGVPIPPHSRARLVYLEEDSFKDRNFPQR